MIHYQIRRLLSAYADGELNEPTQEYIHHHIQQCSSCADKVEKIMFAVRAVLKTDIPQAPESIWQKVEKELFEIPDSRKLDQISLFSMFINLQSHRIKFASVVAGMMLLILSAVWLKYAYNDFIESSVIVRSSSELGFDYGSYLDAIISQKSTATFSEYYNGISVNLEIAHTIANEGNFHICINPGVKPYYDLKEVLVLTNDGEHALQLNYAKDGDMVTIFQQPIANPLSLGERDTKEVVISGVTCWKIIEGNIAVITWESGNTRFVAIGNSVTIDFEEIVSASI
ncbi:MAG: zf-HC2 domain-containing protein [Candidatus Marinimicrobia bacterium]|nr:zf-HC2 domain-containing protein [Candidatus Neomarinimicrobiota bacterium]